MAAVVKNLQRRKAVIVYLLRVVLLLALLCRTAVGLDFKLPANFAPGDGFLLKADTADCAWFCHPDPDGKRLFDLDDGRAFFMAGMLPAGQSSQTYIVICTATEGGKHKAKAHTTTVGTPGPIVLPPPIVPPPIVPPIVPPPDPSRKVSQVTYVFEKDQNNPPRAVSLALQKLNVESGYAIAASEFEDDTVNAAGQTPKQYATALAAAREAGLPALVVQANGTVIRVVKSPTTEVQVLEAAK